MTQKKFVFPQIEESEIAETRIYLEHIYYDLKGKFRNFSELENVVISYASYSSEALSTPQKPEEFAKETIIEPILKYLGFTWKGETKLKSPFGNRWPDYTIVPEDSEDILLYLEAEAVNTYLYSETKGRGQVFQWLLSKAAETEYGIATDGLTWILVKFDEATNQLRDMHKVELRSFYSKLINPKALVT